MTDAADLDTYLDGRRCSSSELSALERDPGDLVRAALSPAHIAIVGASENRDKVGGRPLAYLSRYGYAGGVYPVNPNRDTVQGREAYASLAAVPVVPDMVIVAVPGEHACAAVEEAAVRGARLCIVMASGFAEAGAKGVGLQLRMLRSARNVGMRLVGPNSQGLANFGTGVVASFSTMFSEVEPADGPVAIVSQSGIMSVLPYGLLRERGVGVRHTHALGNGADVTVAEMALAVLHDENVRLLLLYMESIPDPAVLAKAADVARHRDVPIVAIKAGRTTAGQAAAGSHSAALASDDRVVDAFLRDVGIWRAADVHGLVRAAELYLKGWRPNRSQLAVVSNSGATCVMAADMAESLALPLAQLEPASLVSIASHLPEYGTSTNPIDLTAALLGNASLLNGVLGAVSADANVDLVFLGLPVSGRGYDVSAFARDAAACANIKPLVVAAPQRKIATRFQELGVPVFADDTDALAALHQLSSHVQLMRHRREAPQWDPLNVDFPRGTSAFLNEAESLAFLDACSFPVVAHYLCRTEEDARAAFRTLGAPVVAKGCSAHVPHKSDHGLVLLDINDEEEAAAAFRNLSRRVSEVAGRSEGVVVASMVKARHEFILGARCDETFGPVVTLGDGGKHAEALGDCVVLLPPFHASTVVKRLGTLRIAPLIWGRRGDAPVDVEALGRLTVELGRLMTSAQDQIASIDLNPVAAPAIGGGVIILDALVERRRVQS